MNFPNYSPYPGVIPVNMMIAQPVMSNPHVMTSVPVSAMNFANHVSTPMFPLNYMSAVRPVVNVSSSATSVQSSSSNQQDEKPKNTTTVFVGNILDRAPDMMIKIMLQKCGNVVSWKRVQGPTGKLPAFGFCEYDKPESTLRCLRLLNNFAIGDQRLLVKVDQKTTVLLDEYKKKCVEMRVSALGEMASGSDTHWSKGGDKTASDSSDPNHKNEINYDEQYIDARTKAEDQKIVAALKSVLKEYAKELAVPKEEKMATTKSSSEIKSQNPTSPSSNSTSTVAAKDPVRSDGAVMDEDRKQLVNESIKQFREQFKDEDEKMRLDELERNQRIADEMSKYGPRSSLSSANRLAGRLGTRSPVGYRRASSPSGLSGQRLHRQGVEEDSIVNSTIADMDDEDYREKRRQDRRYREREIQYQTRLESWQDRERKRKAYYVSEREKETQRRKDESRRARHLLEFLKDYDDETMDFKYYKGTALSQRLKDREREIALDDRDRQREREEIIEIRMKLLIHNPKEAIDSLLGKYLVDELERVNNAADFVVSNETKPPVVRADKGYHSTKSNDSNVSTPESEFSRKGHHSKPAVIDSARDDDIEMVESSPPPLSPPQRPPTQSWAPVNKTDENDRPTSKVQSNKAKLKDTQSLLFGPTELPVGSTGAAPVPINDITTHVTINPLKVNNRRKTLATPLNQIFVDDDDMDNGGSGYLSSDSQGGNVRSPSHRLKLLLRPLLLERPPKDAEERKRAIKSLIENIPMVRSELFGYPIDWTQMDQQMMNTRIKPWINKKIVEYIGEEESTLTDFICEKVSKNVGPEEILEDVRMVLDDEAEVFVVKMWRLIVYETEAKRNGVTSSTVQNSDSNKLHGSNR